MNFLKNLELGICDVFDHSKLFCLLVIRLIRETDQPQSNQQISLNLNLWQMNKSTRFYGFSAEKCTKIHIKICTKIRSITFTRNERPLPGTVTLLGFTVLLSAVGFLDITNISSAFLHISLFYYLGISSGGILHVFPKYWSYPTVSCNTFVLLFFFRIS